MNPLEDSKANPFEIAKQAAAVIAEKTGVAQHDIALTLGSGWAKAADIIDQAIVLHFRKNDFVGGIDEGVHALIVTNECNLRDGVAALCPSKAGT